MQLVPRSELVLRLRRLQAGLRAADLDGALVAQKAAFFHVAGTAQNGLLFVPPEGEPTLFVRRSVARARAESAWEDVVAQGRVKELPALLAERGRRGFRRLGLELDVVPVALWAQVRDAFAGVEIADASSIVRASRMVKSAYEIERIEGAARQLHEAYALIPGMLRAGCPREIDLAAGIEEALRRRGHQGIIRCRRFGLEMFYGAVSAGATASHPTDFDGPDGVEGLYAAIPQSGGERPIRPGEPIMVDLCGGYDGYTADKTRIFALGGVRDGELVRAHDFALRVQEEVRARLRPGAHTGRIYLEIEAMVKDSPFAAGFMGHADNRSRFVGHGIGLELDELPILMPRSETILEAGMVVAVEPKFFFGERGGVGIENSWLITPGGCRNLTLDDDAIVAV